MGLVGGWGMQSHFHVQPNYSVEVVLRCVVVGVETIANEKSKNTAILIIFHYSIFIPLMYYVCRTLHPTKEHINSVIALPTCKC